jgi:hypothetical protein
MKYDAQGSLSSPEYTTSFPYYYRRGSNTNQNKNTIKDQPGMCGKDSKTTAIVRKKSNNAVGF